LLEKTTEILQLIITKAPLAIKQVIALTNMAASTGDGLKNEIAAFGELFNTSDVKEGAAAFLEKRKPVFRGN
jgi:enoyl-CoA hydratase